MADFLRSWLDSQLDISESLAKGYDHVHTFSKILSNGLLVGEILLKKNLITSQEKGTLFDSNKPGPKIQNMIKIHKWLRDSGFPVQIHHVIEIIQEKPGSALRLLYRLFMWLESPQRIVVNRKPDNFYKHVSGPKRVHDVNSNTNSSRSRSSNSLSDRSDRTKDEDDFSNENKTIIYQLTPPLMVNARPFSLEHQVRKPTSSLYYGMDEFDEPQELHELFANCHFRRFVCCVYKDMLVHAKKPWKKLTDERNQLANISETFKLMKEYDDLIEGKDVFKGVRLKRNLMDKLKGAKNVEIGQEYQDFKKLSKKEFGEKLLESVRKADHSKLNILEIFSGSQKLQEHDEDKPISNPFEIISSSMDKNDHPSTSSRLSSGNPLDPTKLYTSQPPSSSVSKHVVNSDDWLKVSEASLKAPKEYEKEFIRDILDNLIFKSVQERKAQGFRKNLGVETLDPGFKDHNERLNEIFENSDEKMKLINEFQYKFNRVDNQIRREPEIQDRLFQLLAQLQTRILAIVDEKHDEALSIEDGLIHELMHKGDSLDQEITNIFAYFVTLLRIETERFRLFLNTTNTEILDEIYEPLKLPRENYLFEFISLDFFNPDNIYHVRGKIEDDKLAVDNIDDLNLSDFLEGKVSFSSQTSQSSFSSSGSTNSSSTTSEASSVNASTRDTLKQDPSSYFVDKILKKVLDNESKQKLGQRVLKASALASKVNLKEKSQTAETSQDSLASKMSSSIDPKKAKEAEKRAKFEESHKPHMIHSSDSTTKQTTREEFNNLITLLSDHIVEILKMFKECHKKVEYYALDAIDTLKKYYHKRHDKDELVHIITSIRKEIRIHGKVLYTKIGDIEERALNQLGKIKKVISKDFESFEEKVGSLYKKEIECTGLVGEIFKIAITNSTSLRAKIHLNMDNFSVEFLDAEKIHVEPTAKEIKIEIQDKNQLPTY